MRFSRLTGSGLLAVVLPMAALTGSGSLYATPANKSALEKHLGPLLVDTMQNCAICHTHDHGTGLESLEEFPTIPSVIAFVQPRRNLKKTANARGYRIVSPMSQTRTATETV